MTQNIDTAKQWLKESDAEMLSFRVVAYSGMEEILRGWPASKIPKDKLEICKAYLIERGSEINNKQSWTIKDPLVDKEEWFGTWQHFDEGWQVFNKQLYLTQTIRKGYYRDVPYQISEISSDRTIQTRQQLRLTTQTPEPIVAVAGQVKSQNVNVNEGDGTKTVRTDKDTGIAQTNVTTARSPDATAVTTEKTMQTAALAASTPTAGTIRRIINAVSRYYQRYTTTETVETGVAQEVVNTVRAPDATTVVTDKTVQTAQATVPVLQAGVLKRIKSVWSKYFNRWNTTEEVETGIAQTVVDEVVDTGLVKSVVEEKTVQAAKLPDPAPPTLASPGVIVSIINRASRYFQRWTTRKKTDTSKHVSVNEYIAHIGDRNTVYHSEEKHAADAPNIMTYKDSAGVTKTATLDAQENPLDADGKSVELSILSHNLDDFLTRNYTKSRTVKKFPISDADNESGISWPVYGDMETVTVQGEYHIGSGVWGKYVEYVYKYQIVDTVTQKYFTSAKAARNWIVSKNTTSDLSEDPLANLWTGLKTKYDENNLSTFSGSGTEWKAVAVVRTYSLRATYHYNPPS